MKSQINYLKLFWFINFEKAGSKILFTLRPEINLVTEEVHYWISYSALV